MNIMAVDMFGRRLWEAGTEGMTYPVRHTACRKVHDAAGSVEVVGRYADCTRWKCPHCGGICDDRAIGWGGNVVRLSTQSEETP